MNTPPIVQASLLTILKFGLLNIRYHAERKSSERCAIEANHLHNIPGLLENFSIDLLKFYIDIEMPQYVRETDDRILAEIRSAWVGLHKWLSESSHSLPEVT
jgi:hypothetical protein